MSGTAGDEQRLRVAREVGEALAHGRMPALHLFTEDPLLVGTMFDTTLGALTDDLAARLAALVAQFPRYAFHPREVHAAPGERVIMVGVAVSPGSSALTAAVFGFRGDRICSAHSFRHPAEAFAHVGLVWDGPARGAPS